MMAPPAWAPVSLYASKVSLYVSPYNWANESYSVTQQPDVGYCVLSNGICAYSTTELLYRDGAQRTVLAQDAYEDQFGQIVRERIKQAGTRLGALLNDVLG